MTIGKKLLTSFGSMLVLSAAMGTAYLSSIGSLKDELTATNETARTIDSVGAINTAGSDMLAGMRSMIMFAVLQKQDRYRAARERFDAAARQWQKSVDEARGLTSRQDAREALGRLQEHVVAWQGVIREVDVAVARGDLEGAYRIGEEKAYPIYEANLHDAQVYTAAQNQVLADRRAGGETVASRSRWTAIALLVLSIALGASVVAMVRQTSTTLQRAAGDLSLASTQVAGAAGQISSSSQSLAQGASEQAASVQETSASSQELTAMTRQNADASRQAAELMGEMGGVVENANQTLSGMEASMQEINASSDKIGRIIKVIDEIAFQTNILALNAAVEAARAGEAGMGFAVVADEVRNLAQRSAQAAKDTAALIEESIARSGEGRVRLNAVSSAIHEITVRAGKVKHLIEGVHTASGEQSRGIEQIAEAVVQMERVAQQSAAGAEQAASAGEELSAQASGLKDVVGRLQGLVGTART